MGIKIKIWALFLTSYPFISNAQLNEYNLIRHDLDQKLMIGLGSWATLNVIVSSIGWSNAANEEIQSFHQMNIMWNTVNLGLAIPGYIRARRGKSDLTLSETLYEQRKTETVFLFNTGLDLAYISSGLILRSESKSYLDKSSLYRGYGNSLLMQGGFLLVFDWIAYGIHCSRSKKRLQPILEKIELSDSGFGFKYKF
jgi:hypothetical protein